MGGDQMIAATKLEVKDSLIAGRGVFATASIAKGEILEECHFFKATGRDYKSLDNLKDLVFNYPINVKNCVLVLGFGSIYNHSVDGAAYWETDTEAKLFRFIASRDIPVGAEILMDYKTPSAP